MTVARTAEVLIPGEDGCLRAIQPILTPFMAPRLQGQVHPDGWADLAIWGAGVAERSKLAHFDMRQLVEQVQIGSFYVDELPFTQNDEAKARRLLAKFEASRQSRLGNDSHSGRGDVNA